MKTIEELLAWKKTISTRPAYLRCFIFRDQMNSERAVWIIDLVGYHTSPYGNETIYFGGEASKYKHSMNISTALTDKQVTLLVSIYSFDLSVEEYKGHPFYWLDFGNGNFNWRECFPELMEEK